MKITTIYSKNNKIIDIFTINCSNFHANKSVLYPTCIIKNNNFYYIIFLRVQFPNFNNN